MAKGPTIALGDIVPRRLRTTDTTGAVTLPAGSTMADARRQLVLRTFATMGGDIDRTAKTLGIAAAEVRSEIASVLGGNGAHAAQGSSKPVAASTKEPKRKTKSKGRR